MANDIYSLGFDTNLNKPLENSDSPLVYDTFSPTQAQDVTFGVIATGTANSIIIVDPTKGLWIGNTNFSLAPFSVSMNGDITANSIVLGRSGSGSGITSFTISGLNLDADLGYRIQISTITSNNPQSLLMTFNGDSGANYTWGSSENGAAFGTTTGDTAIQILPLLTAAANGISDILIKRNVTNDFTQVIWSSSTSVANINGALAITSGSGRYINTANITSVTFAVAAGTFSYTYRINVGS